MSKKSCSGCPSAAKCKPKNELPEANSFWNTCPRKLDALPDTPCSMGTPLKSKKGRILEEPACPWWIDDEKSNYCYWRWLQTNSLPNGRMDHLLQNEIAQLFGCSSTKIHFIIKDGIKRLQESEHLDFLKELFDSSSESDDPNNSTSLHGLDIPDQGESEE